MPILINIGYRVGQYIYGESEDDWSGYYVSILSYVKNVDVGPYKNYGNYGNVTNSGHVRVYFHIENSWV